MGKMLAPMVGLDKRINQPSSVFVGVEDGEGGGSDFTLNPSTMGDIIIFCFLLFILTIFLKTFIKIRQKLNYMRPNYFPLNLIKYLQKFLFYHMFRDFLAFTIMLSITEIKSMMKGKTQKSSFFIDPATKRGWGLRPGH